MFEPCTITGKIDVSIVFELLKVKLPIDFLGTKGFSLHREGRYSQHFHARKSLEFSMQDAGCGIHHSRQLPSFSWKYLFLGSRSLLYALVFLLELLYFRLLVLDYASYIFPSLFDGER